VVLVIMEAREMVLAALGPIFPVAEVVVVVLDL
jgi:hypothetical protein